MNKLAMLLTAMLVAGAVVIKMNNDADVPAVNPLEGVQETQRVDHLRDDYQSFKEVFDASLVALEKGEITLTDARARVETAARLHNPNYLTYISYYESGKTDEERVARNLAGHLRGTEVFKPHLTERVRELDCELDVYISELEYRGTN